MNIVPIVFAFDNNIILPACVCISSLLMNAKPDTYYEIYILHSSSETLDEDRLNRISRHYSNCCINFLPVGNDFENAYEIRGVTKATYYRLLIPNILTQFNKIIYSDVDIIFRMDLSEVYNLDIADNYLAATLDIGINQDTEYLRKVGIERWQYLQAGFIVMNLHQMRSDHLVEQFVELGKGKFKYQDQDILNIACKGRVYFLPPRFNVNDCAYIYMYWHPELLPKSMTAIDIEAATKGGNIHYSGYKPWKRYSVSFDIWWEYYRKSIFYDELFYFKFFFDKTMYLDSLSLWKRMKILARYFIYGRYKG